MKINQMNEFINWWLIWAIGCTGCNVFLFIVLLNFEELRIVQIVLIGVTVMWWVIFFIFYFKDMGTLKNPKEIDGTIIGKSFMVVFLGRGEFIVRAKVIADDKQFYSYTGVCLLDFFTIKKKGINLPCKVLINKKRNKQAIIYFKDAIYNMNRDNMN